MARMRRSDSSSAERASAERNLRACSRSSAAIVCRLFFTRWWISRIVASFVTSIRSRWRMAVTSRSSTMPPTTVCASSRGKACTTTDDSPRCISTITGAGDRYIASIGDWSKPTSPSWSPVV